MIRPYEIVDGEIVEHKLSYDMTVNMLDKENPPRQIKINESTTIAVMTEKCSCGSEFRRVSALINHCEQCFDMYDNLKHYLYIQNRNKEFKK